MEDGGLHDGQGDNIRILINLSGIRIFRISTSTAVCTLYVQTQRLVSFVIRIICTRNGPNLLLNSNKCRNHQRVQNLFLFSFVFVQQRAFDIQNIFVYWRGSWFKMSHQFFLSALSIQKANDQRAEFPKKVIGLD